MIVIVIFMVIVLVGAAVAGILSCSIIISSIIIVGAAAVSMNGARDSSRSTAISPPSHRLSLSLPLALFSLHSSSPYAHLLLCRYSIIAVTMIVAAERLSQLAHS